MVEVGKENELTSVKICKRALWKFANLLVFIGKYTPLLVIYKFVWFWSEFNKFVEVRNLSLPAVPFLDKGINKCLIFIVDKAGPPGAGEGLRRSRIRGGGVGQGGGKDKEENAPKIAITGERRINISHAAELILSRVKQGIGIKMDQVLNAYLTAAVGEESDFPACDSPVWIFGRSYSVHYDIEELRRSVSSCLWITYRKNFPSIAGTTLTSDKGWGCMIRVGQMLVAKALLLRHLDQNWHWDPDCRDQFYLRILSMFEDSKRAPLSLHRIAESGATLGKAVGSWLGPNTVAQALRRLFLCDQMISSTVDLAIHIAMDSTLVKAEIKQECLASSPDKKWKPLLLVVPLRLGLSDLNDAYIPGIKGVLENPQSIGIIGGRPNHALYFIGYADKEVLYLDPHTVQPAVSVSSKATDEERAADETYHIRRPGRMSFSSMDPSIALCFFCKSELDFDGMCAKLIERFTIAPLPLFEICEDRPKDVWMSDFDPDMAMPTFSGSSSNHSTRPTQSTSSSSASVFNNMESPPPPSSFTGKKQPKSKKGSKSSDTGEDDEDFEILG